MLIFCPISTLGDAYERFLSDAYKKKTCIPPFLGPNGHRDCWIRDYQDGAAAANLYGRAKPNVNKWISVVPGATFI